MTDVSHALDCAFDAAADAAFATLAAVGDKGDCGSAFVVIKPARGAVVKELKARGIGSKHWNGGWQVPIAAGLKRETQCRIVFEKACDRFAEVLENFGFPGASTYSYAD